MQTPNRHKVLREAFLETIDQFDKKADHFMLEVQVKVGDKDEWFNIFNDDHVNMLEALIKLSHVCDITKHMDVYFPVKVKCKRLVRVHYNCFS